MASDRHAEKPTPPVPPEKPLPTDCCETGCEVCVFDAYADALKAYEKALADYRRSAAERAGPKPAGET